PDLLGEHPTEDDQVPVPDENVDDSVHCPPEDIRLTNLAFESERIASSSMLQGEFRLTASSVGHGGVPAAPRGCRPSGARWPGDAGMAALASKNHGWRRDRHSCRHHGGTKTRGERRPSRRG